MVEWEDLTPGAQWLLAAVHERPRTLEQLIVDCPLAQLCAELPDAVRELRANELVRFDPDGPLHPTHDGEALATRYVDGA